MRPTAQTLADFYFKKVPVKTGWLRPDSLAILLSLANVGANSRTLVVDGTGGLIAGESLQGQILSFLLRTLFSNLREQSQLGNLVGLVSAITKG